MSDTTAQLSNSKNQLRKIHLLWDSQRAVYSKIDSKGRQTPGEKVPRPSHTLLFPSSETERKSSSASQNTRENVKKKV